MSRTLTSHAPLSSALKKCMRPAVIVGILATVGSLLG